MSQGIPRGPTPFGDFRLTGANLVNLTLASVRDAFFIPYKSRTLWSHSESFENPSNESITVKLSIGEGKTSYVIRASVYRCDAEANDSPSGWYARVLAHTAAWMNWNLYTTILGWGPPIGDSDQYELPLYGEPQHPLHAGLSTFTSGVYRG